ncbi:MAG: HAD-IB family hydrolase [Deltaproteobacteria bacterium]|nr:HAD-IB family hydrolase [Deltaproteobacteria bacterium]
MTESTYRAAAYFDVDGTLTKTNLFDTLWFYLLNQQNPFAGLGRVAKTVASIPGYLAADQVDRSTFNEMLFQGYEGFSEDRLLDLSDEVFDNVLRPALYKDALSLVKRAKQSGLRVVLLSGSPDFLLQRLGKMLDADDIIGNRLQFKDGRATGKLMPPIVAGPEKAKIIKDHAKQHGFDLDDCAAYSDSMSDVPMLSVVGRPAAVNPDFRLRAMAKTHRWPILDLH